MRKKIKRPKPENLDKDMLESIEDIFDFCVEKGLIEKTEFGYYFKPEFFETLKIYEKKNL